MMTNQQRPHTPFGYDEQLQRLEWCKEQEKDKQDWGILINSIKRPYSAFVHYLYNECSEEFIKQRVVLITSPAYYAEYKRNCPPCFEIISMEGADCGCGLSRKLGIQYVASARKWEYVLAFDDDIKALEFAYAGYSGRGDPCSKHSNKKDHQRIAHLGELVLYGCIASTRTIHKALPTAIRGALRAQHFSNGEDTCKTLAKINKGAYPSHCYFMHVPSMTEDLDFYYPEQFYITGEDIASSLQTLNKNKQIFTLQWLMMDFVSEQVDSTIRSPNEEENREIHAYELAELRKLHNGNCVKNGKSYADGTYMYAAIDWNLYYATNPDAAPCGLMKLDGPGL